MAKVGGERFDLLVVGSGPAGEKAAAQAAYFGRRVAVVERDRPGGTMVAGAVSTKTMREAALYLTGFTRHQIYGVGLDLLPEALVDRLRAREADVTEMMTEAVRRNLRRHDIAYVEGTARLGPEHTLTVRPADGRPERVLAADAILLAPGSRPFHPPGIPFDDPGVLDSETAGALDRPLRSLVVVGGGAVVCEYASIFQALGAAVVLVDRGPRLLPFLDADISALLADIFSDRGMRVLSSTGVAGVTRVRWRVACRDLNRGGAPDRNGDLRGRPHRQHRTARIEGGRRRHRRSGAHPGRRALRDVGPRDLRGRRRHRPPGPGLRLHGAGPRRGLLRHGHPLQADGGPPDALRRVHDPRVRHGGIDATAGPRGRYRACGGRGAVRGQQPGGHRRARARAPSSSSSDPTTGGSSGCTSSGRAPRN